MNVGLHKEEYERTNSQGKRRRSRPLDRRVRPEGQKGAPRLEDVRSPRKTAGPRKRRSAARRIAGSACCTSAGGPKGLKPLEHGGALEQVAARIKRVMGLTKKVSGLP